MNFEQWEDLDLSDFDGDFRVAIGRSAAYRGKC